MFEKNENKEKVARFGQESREVLDTRIVIINFVGWRPGLVVMGRDSGSEGCGFKSWHHILDGHFFTYICCKNCNVCLKRPKINKKEAGIGPFLIINFEAFTYTHIQCEPIGRFIGLEATFQSLWQQFYCPNLPHS